MTFAETGLPWVMPSPNMPTPDTALVYPGQCLFEATNLSEGRGTTRPFELVGAPFLDGYDWAARAASPGVRLRPLSFRPTFHKSPADRAGASSCTSRTRPRFARTRRAGAHRGGAPAGSGDFRWRTEPYEFVADPPAIDLLTGDDRVRRAIDAGAPLRDVLAEDAAFERTFAEVRRPALVPDYA